MKRNEIEQHITIQNSEHNIESLVKELETEDIIIYHLITSKKGYVYPRYVNLLALKLHPNKDYWICFAPTENQLEVFEKDLPKLFKRVWNSNIENKGGMK